MSNGNIHIDEEHLMSYLLREADEQLAEKVDHWLSLSQENRTLLDELEAAWVESGKLKIKPVVVDVDKAWGSLSARMDAGEKPTIKMEPENRGMPRLAQIIIRVAAVLVLGVGLWSIRNAMLKPKMQVFITENAVEKLDLPDGSKVDLNENSTFRAPEKFAGNVREVELKGEAYFNIEPNKDKPFIIRASDAYVKVLGTSFNMKALEESNDVEVYVEEGIVMLYTIDQPSSDTSSVILTMGETGLYDKETKQVMKVGRTGIEVMYWLNKTLIFKETELSMVFEILTKTYDVTIQFEDSTINHCVLDAIFRDEKIEYILDVVAITFGLEVEKSDDNIYIIKGEGCK